MHRWNADRTVKYKMWSSWKSIPQHSSSQAFFLMYLPLKPIPTLDPVSPHLSTPDKESEGARTHHGGRCHGKRLCGNTWMVLGAWMEKFRVRPHQETEEKTTNLRRCEKHSSQRHHPEPGDNSYPKQTPKTVSFQPTGICLLVVQTAAFYGKKPFWHLPVFIFIFFSSLFWTKISVFQVDSDQIWFMLSKLRK